MPLNIIKVIVINRSMIPNHIHFYVKISQFISLVFSVNIVTFLADHFLKSVQLKIKCQKFHSNHDFEERRGKITCPCASVSF